MLEIIGLAIAITGGVFAFGFARGFVRRRLRFVDAVKSPAVPFLAAAVAALIVWPVTWLPLIPWLAAAMVGVGAGFGTASGVKALKRGES